VSAPSVAALGAQEFKVPLLESFGDKELFAVPLVSVFLEKPAEGPLTGPFD